MSVSYKTTHHVSPTKKNSVEGKAYFMLTIFFHSNYYYYENTGCQNLNLRIQLKEFTSFVNLIYLIK